MNSTMYAVAAIAVMSAVTIALRFLPFIALGKRKTPRLVTYLGKVLPSAIMGMLVVYCLKDMDFAAVQSYVPQIIAGLVVVLSYIWKRNTLLSIVAGTACFMVLVQVVF